MTGSGGVRRLLAHRDARWYLAGQGLSMLGDTSMWLAAGIWVKTLTGSNGAAGMSFFCFTVPALLAPLMGTLVDRVRRRRVLIAANLAGAVVLTPLLLVHNRGQVWLIFLVMLMYGAVHLLIDPAQSALLAGMVPDALLPDANGLLRTLQEGFRIAAPVLGAGLFAVVGDGRVVALVDIATFLAAAGFVAALRYREPPRERVAHTGPVAEVLAGFRYIAGHRVLRRALLAFMVAMTVFGFVESLLFAVIGQGLHRPPTFLGVTQVAQGVGAIGAGLVSAVTIRRFGEIRVVVAGLVAFAVGSATLVVPLLPVALAGLVVAGGGLTWLAIAAVTLLQRQTPDALQGRVNSGFEIATTGPQTVSIALGAWLVTVLDFRVVLAVESVVLLVAAALMVRAHRAAAGPTDAPVDPVPPAEPVPAAATPGGMP